MLLQWIGIVAAIIVVDLALSGDNALVIGAVASRLPARERRVAIIFGGVMAIALRIALAEAAVFVLRITFIQALGGLIVFAIAAQIMAQRVADGSTEHTTARKRWTGQEHLLRASLTILVADVSMSLDNVLAVAALANGNYLVLVLGLMFSMMLLLVASAGVAKLMERFPALLYLAGIILAWTAGTMVLNDQGIHPFIMSADNQVPGPPLVWLIPPLFVAALLAFWAILLWRRGRQRKPDRTAV